MSSASRRWLGRGALALGSAALALVVAEVALRALGVTPARYGQPARLEAEDKRRGLDLYPDDPRGYFPLDLREPETRSEWRGLPRFAERWERTPHAVPFRYSPQLCRGADVAPAAGRARVLVIGDSFTEGQGVREEDTFAARLDRSLEAQVINCGRRGYDFPRIHEWFDLKVEELSPRVVLYAMVLNDPEQSEAFHERQAFLDDWIVARRQTYTEGTGAPPPTELRLTAMIADRVEGWRVGRATTDWYRDMVAAPNRDGWEATLGHLEAMNAAMEARGGALLVALWPLLVDLDGDYPFRDVHRTIREALEARSIRFVDTLDELEGRDPRALWVHPADRHPNERAHLVFAERVEGTLRSLL